MRKWSGSSFINFCETNAFVFLYVASLMMYVFSSQSISVVSFTPCSLWEPPPHLPNGVALTEEFPVFSFQYSLLT